MAFAQEHSESWRPAQALLLIRGSLCKQQAFLCSANTPGCSEICQGLFYLTLTADKDKTISKAPGPAPIGCANFEIGVYLLQLSY